MYSTLTTQGLLACDGWHLSHRIAQCAAEPEASERPPTLGFCKLLSTGPYLRKPSDIPFSTEAPADTTYKNNANEGPLFVPATIVTLDDLIAWLHLEFPNLSDAQIQQILAAYPSPSTPVDPQTIKIETNGYGPPYAINVSQVATGQQQRANVRHLYKPALSQANTRQNILAEATFVCPSYWLATAFTGPGKTAYHYQYSIPFAAHRADVTAYVGPATPNQGPLFTQAIRSTYFVG